MAKIQYCYMIVEASYTLQCRISGNIQTRQVIIIAEGSEMEAEKRLSRYSNQK